jgi:hypothetical protein
MKHPVKIATLASALVAVLLLGAIAASAASAAEFQAKPSFPVKFSAEGGAGLLETKAGHSVTCQSTSASGEVSGATAVAGLTVRFKGCFAEHLAVLPCTTSGAASGEIVTNTIVGKPVDLDTLHVQVGLLLESSATAGVFAEFTCESTNGLPVKEKIKVTGSVIGQVKTTQLNEFRSTLNLEFVQAGGVQAWTQVEGAGAQHFLLTEGTGTAPFAAEQSAVGEAAPGTTTTTALEGKQIKLVP